MVSVKNLVLGASLLSSSIALPAFAGGATSGGGDLSLIGKSRSAYLLNEKRMKNRLKEYLMRLEILDHSPEDEILQAAFQKILPGLQEDIKKSPYVFSGPCLDEQGNAKAASTLNNVPGATVCFDPVELAKHEVSEATLVGLALHEHARHLGYADEDHALATYAISDYEMTKAIRAPQERGLSLDNRSQMLVYSVLCMISMEGDKSPRFLEASERFYQSPAPTNFEELFERQRLGRFLKALISAMPGLTVKRPYDRDQAFDKMRAALNNQNASFLGVVRAFDSIFQMPDDSQE